MQNTSMIDMAYLSSKQPLVSQRGYALGHNQQPRYACDWHRHDCTMLLWPQIGSLKTTWLDDNSPRLVNTNTAKLTRNTAILLPRDTLHKTVSDTAHQRHGELYIASELLREGRRQGAIHLDGATMAMLDALLAPQLDPRSAEYLVHAIVSQLKFVKHLDVPPERPSLAQKMIKAFLSALLAGEALPSVEMVACKLGVSTRQLQRLCQAELGASPVTVRRHLLATRARTLLAHGQSFADVSTHLGFATSGHLARLLRSVQS